MDEITSVVINVVKAHYTNLVVDVLSSPVEAEGYGYNEQAARKFVSELMTDPEKFAEFIDDFAPNTVNLEDPLEDGEYAD